MRVSPALRVCIAALAMTAMAFAGEITGTATNRTKNKPAAGDEVILLKLSEGMQEVAHTKVDATGHFKLTTPDDTSSFLIRVKHGNVNYHRPAPPGTTSVEIEVYDSAEQLPEVTQSVDVMRLEADATTLRVMEGYALTNPSKPPRTLMSEKSFEVVLPDGAKIDQAAAFGPGGMPVTVTPVPTGEKDHYRFLFPIRPGETRFQVEYSLPYGGSATLTPKLVRPTQNFAVSLPKPMQLVPETGSRLEPRGEEAGMAVYVAANAAPGQALGFTVSGTGSAPAEDASQTAGADGQSLSTNGGSWPGLPYCWWAAPPGASAVQRLR